jgi:hypothetical protein
MLETLMLVWTTVEPAIPVVNVLSDVVRGVATGEGPSWWVALLKAYETVLVCQLLLPTLERWSKKTANTWDDSVVARLKNLLAFALEIVAAVSAIDPDLGRRLKEVRVGIPPWNRRV